jgi:hypothetical protein
MILMWNIHWRTQYNEDRGWALYDAKKDTFSWQFVKDYYCAAIPIYLIWAVLYYVIVFILLKKRIKERNYDTLVAYHITRNTAVGKWVLKLGPGYAGLIYVASHFTAITVIFTVTIICYFSYYFNLMVIVLTSSVSFWNGATFYMDYFSKKYEANLAKLDELHEQVSSDIIKGSTDKKND